LPLGNAGESAKPGIAGQWVSEDAANDIQHFVHPPHYDHLIVPRSEATAMLNSPTVAHGASYSEFGGYSTPRNLNGRTDTVVWLALSLDPIDRQHGSTKRPRRGS
jgi:hypothetical protein